MPIMTFKCLTSMLGECALFEVEIKRCDAIRSFSICLTEAALFQDQNFAKDFVKVLCLNSTLIHVNYLFI